MTKTVQNLFRYAPAALGCRALLGSVKILDLKDPIFGINQYNDFRFCFDFDFEENKILTRRNLQANELTR